MSEAAKPGVSGMSLYVPRLRVSLEDWCAWTGNSWDKIQAVVGRSFRVPARHENVYTMAANAVLRLLRQYDVDPRSVGFLGLGTESSTDNAAGAVIVRGMVDRALDDLGMPRLSRHCEVPEFKHACLGGIYALKAALRYVNYDAGDKVAIVVCADVAEYERGSSGEQTQGAGAVAMLVTREARMFEVDLARSGSASDYRGPDFRKPFARHFRDDYAVNTHRMNDFPVFSGKYSTFSYLDETVHAVEDMLRKLNVSAGKYYSNVHSLFFHRPYQMMPVQAMSFLYVRGLARGDHHQEELKALCDEAGVSPEAVTREALSMPDLYAAVRELGAAVSDPYEATTAVAGVLRKKAAFRRLLEQKMSLGGSRVQNLGNLYSAALPSWIAAGFEEGAQSGADLTHRPMVAVGYGSGDAAEAWPFRAVPGWQEAAKHIQFSRSLDGAIDLTRAQYEALHDGHEVTGLNYIPTGEFVISHVGEKYEPAFQDLGVEYYKYIAAVDAAE
jgi:hydroxymethylglutaryl-CoA synthase